jgi:hypothetical protein
MPLYFDLAPGDVVKVGEVKLSLEYKTGARARVAIDAPGDKSISIDKSRRTNPLRRDGTGIETGALRRANDGPPGR